ncbi:PWI domain-containing protein [Hysterangium stoloniferum]|nr:PWI domain-containing protein [Hysterangium stoloniferum]
MADAGFFRGTSTDQDRRFSDKETKLLKSMKFPPSFEKKVDMRKVNLQVLRPWITQKVTELVGLEDELVVEYAMGLLEDESQPTPDPRKMQINLTGFLTKSTSAFMTALWSLLLEAQASPAGIPQSFVDAKKAEMRNANKGDEKMFEERARRSFTLTRSLSGSRSRSRSRTPPVRRGAGSPSTSRRRPVSPSGIPTRRPLSPLLAPRKRSPPSQRPPRRRSSPSHHRSRPRSPSPSRSISRSRSRSRSPRRPTKRQRTTRASPSPGPGSRRGPSSRRGEGGRRRG